MIFDDDDDLISPTSDLRPPTPPLTMTKALIFYLESLEKGPFTLSGEVPGAFLELEKDTTVRNIGPICYDLQAELSGNEVLVRGQIEVTLELECVRSGAFFSTKLSDSAFLRDYSTEDAGESLNLAEDVREAVLILIPTYPVSPEAQSADFVMPKFELGGDEDVDSGEKSPWNDLDQLNL